MCVGLSLLNKIINVLLTIFPTICGVKAVCQEGQRERDRKCVSVKKLRNFSPWRVTKRKSDNQIERGFSSAHVHWEILLYWSTFECFVCAPKRIEFSLIFRLPPP